MTTKRLTVEDALKNLKLPTEVENILNVAFESTAYKKIFSVKNLSEVCPYAVKKHNSYMSFHGINGEAIAYSWVEGTWTWIKLEVDEIDLTLLKFYSLPFSFLGNPEKIKSRSGNEKDIFIYSIKNKASVENLTKVINILLGEQHEGN